MSHKNKKDDVLRQLAELAGEKLPADDARQIQAFIRTLYLHAAPDDISGRNPRDLYGALLSHWELLSQRTPGTPKVRIYSPILEQDDWQSTHSVVEIVSDDMPFLVDSVRMALNRHGLTVHLIIHCVGHVLRDATGQMIDFSSPDADAISEAVIYVEVDRRTEAAIFDKLRNDLLEMFADVRVAVEDWGAMRERLNAILPELDNPALPIEVTELEECKAFLNWVESHHFTFLSYRQYELAREDDGDVLRVVPDSALGLARRTPAHAKSQTFAALTAERRARFRSPELLILTKANQRSTTHRPVYMDYIGIKRFDDKGQVVGEHRFLGLYTSAAYNRNPRDIPLLRERIRRVFDNSDLVPHSHNGKALLNILETYPRDELFQITEQELLDNAMGILHLQERQHVRLFMRHEIFGRFVSCIVFVPRERFDSAVRLRIQHILMDAFGGESVDYNVHLSESVLARLYFIIHTRPDSLAVHNIRELEACIIDAMRTWEDELDMALLEQYGEEAGAILFKRYHRAFPVAYRDDFNPRAAVRDIEDIEELTGPNGLNQALYQALDASPDQFRFKLFSEGQALALSDILPMLENMGVRVIRERPYKITPDSRGPLWIYDFTLSHHENGGINIDEIKTLFQETFAKVWFNEAENDGFNSLVLHARLKCREIIMLRAYCKYLRQTGIPFSQTYMAQVLANNAGLTRKLVEMFHARFNIHAQEHAAIRRSSLAAEIQDTLEAVESLDEDRILRGFFGVILATVRTNYYQIGVDGNPKDYLAFKLDPTQMAELPLPRPLHEISVYSPRVEGVHLRGGDVARGGLRWSDRREDFRTEVLGLMKAQMVKNAIIVPVGAKGGFVVKQPPPGADRDALMTEVIACYQTFIRGLLDVTDNIVDGNVQTPRQLIRYDNDDPYLVVAADKGTASFSDIANTVAREYGFWLDDAFASGGSSGYDHKKMGITARGAWESVKRHFRELGKDIQTSDFTVIGIGDMSGDVFGNGMLLSRHIKLVVAFDHRHIFLDPNPDPETSFRERERMFCLPRSSWADYDTALLSEGGGIFARSAKAIHLSPQVRQVLGTSAESLTPDALIRITLKAPVDLLWNGGIGTYVKASSESDSEAGDRSNDGVRINGKQLRCKVVGEGGNLGFTQKGRVEYALSGGRINTDFIDNAGGVSCSDYEVNIKILLNSVVNDGVLDMPQRNALLAEMTDEVAQMVLQENYWQTWTISAMASQSLHMADQHMRFIRGLERTGKLDRTLEYLPDDEALIQRQAAGQGLTRPELAVLLTYAKNDIYQKLLMSDAPDDPYLARELLRYFPAPLRERFNSQIRQHRLRRELISTFVTNRIVNRLGATFVFRLQEEEDASVAQIVRAYLAVWEAFDLRQLSSAVAQLDNICPADIQTHMLFEGMDLVRRSTIWLLQCRTDTIDITQVAQRYQSGVQRLIELLPSLLTAEQSGLLELDAAPLREASVPEALVKRVSYLPYLYSALDVIEVTHETGASVDQAAALYFALDAFLELGWLRQQIETLPGDDRWHARARATLQDDLYDQQRLLTADILRQQTDSQDPTAQIGAWMTQTHGRAQRFQQLIADLKTVPTVDLPMLSVALRELQGLSKK